MLSFIHTPIAPFCTRARKQTTLSEHNKPIVPSITTDRMTYPQETTILLYLQSIKQCSPQTNTQQNRTLQIVTRAAPTTGVRYNRLI